MSSPKAQPAAKPQGAATYGVDRRKPTAFFLAVLVEPFPHHPHLAANGKHVYVGRREDGMYRLWCQGTAMLLTEGVARRHLRRVKGADGAAVRVSAQQKWLDRWNEAYSESLRGRVA